MARLPRRCLLALLFLVSARVSHAQSLVACGWDEVFVLDVSGPPSRIWRWKAADAPELPEAFRSKFRTTDDCKPVAGDRLLVTASSDGAALIDRATRRAVWWASCGNTHSAELLPGDRIVLACSVRPETGNRLALFDAATPVRELASTELESAHGVVWDAARERLWALGLHELRAYRLKDWDGPSPSLDLDARYALPDEGGHELSAVPGTAHLIVSTHAGVWRFDRDLRTFSPDPDLRGLHDVKSVVIHPVTRRLAYTQAEVPEWWTSRIRFARPAGEVVLDGERLYKVRWIP
ncbi:DUF6528 family protein [Luteitalea sp. TBR-22]|uniref:DUF6528 family protein n=1 Tax=Luteitalea sp. TBR-22 TaxID=2802971 RepID=UPI001EF423A1|nr:DUF6528 family protein [Luteitalea sp. TBR-22]